MNIKEYNNLLSELSEIIKPLNQLLYEILILIALYFLFNNLKTNNTENPNKYANSTNNNINIS